MAKNLRQWRLHRPAQLLTLDNFTLEPFELRSELGEGEIRVRTLYIALDPYLARAMQNWQGEVEGWKQGVIHGRIIGEIIESADENFKIGGRIMGLGRWQEEEIFGSDKVQKIAPEITPPSLMLGLLGASGLSAWVGLHLANPRPNETILISAATGPVGSTAAQLSKKRGLHVVGIAGGAEKCAAAMEQFGFDTCLDHRMPDLSGRIGEAAPGGVHILFENVGAKIINAALPHMNMDGRIMLCGLAAHYNSDEPFDLPNFKEFLYRQIKLQPFITARHSDFYPKARAELMAGWKDGSINAHESITNGLENAAKTYLAMLKGVGIGKRIIKI